MKFKVFVTVTHKKDKIIPIWNRVLLALDGDKTDLINLQKQFGLVKQDVNKDINRRNIALRDVDINIDFAA